MIFGALLLGFARAIILLAEIKDELVELRKPAVPPPATAAVVAPRRSPIEEVPTVGQPYRL
jgi:hypothetical protein